MHSQLYLAAPLHTNQSPSQMDGKMRERQLFHYEVFFLLFIVFFFSAPSSGAQQPSKQTKSQLIYIFAISHVL